MILIARPGPILQGSFQVIRGGCWYSPGQNCRSARCLRLVPMLRDNLLGFRAILRKRG